MRKAVVEGGMQIKEGSGRRYWVRANPPPGTNGPAAGKASKKRSKARFLEPYHLGEARRAELAELLDAGGIGDAEGRGLFAAAIEYDIAAYRQSASSEPAPKPKPEPKAAAPQPVPDPNIEAEMRVVDLLHALGESAAALVQTMAALEPSARERLAVQLKQADAFKRDYSSDYLDVLGAELSRVAEAARAVPRPVALSPPSSPPSPPRLTEGARRFLRRVARVYEECLDAAAGVDEAFLLVLDLVTAEAGIQPPTDPEVLASILSGS